ncbi:MAG: hypothetical protein JWP27_3059, partial [Flaviaesturariibacter sp.]|nr:hypothetical protein [Flaviaesturariibacter sp.]
MSIAPEEKRARVETGGPRKYRVRTAEGAARYGVPIGSLITLDQHGRVVGAPPVAGRVVGAPARPAAPAAPKPQAAKAPGDYTDERGRSLRLYGNGTAQRLDANGEPSGALMSPKAVAGLALTPAKPAAPTAPSKAE